MTVAITSPITGAAQTGLTSPTYTHVADTAPNSAGKQYAITALGGTQTGVDVHSVAKPFTITVERPLVLKSLPPVNPVTGLLSGNLARNVYVVRTRKGMLPLAGQAPVVAITETRISVPVGADLAEPANVRAMLSAHIGALSQISPGMGDTCVNGVL